MSEPETGPNPPSRTSPAAPGYLIHIYPAGPEVGTRYEIGDEPVFIGRHDDCSVRNLDGSVSRHHAQIARAVGGAHVVLDMGSTNGTYVNNQRRQLATLADGDCLRVGNCLYRYFTGDDLEARYREEMYRLTVLDGLTAAHNHRSLVGFLDTELAHSRQHGRPLSLLMFDIDHFRAVNERLGQLAGDVLLRELADVVRPSVRKEDLFARYGGEEFVLVLVETPHDEALAAAERLRQTVADHEFRFEATPVRLTVSVGLAGTFSYAPVTPGSLLRTAEERLAQAKQGGRNRVVGAAAVAAGPVS
jgi:diguanylate cyclase (GGDEF)-like protein